MNRIALLSCLLLTQYYASPQSFRDTVTMLNIEELSKPKIKWLSLSTIDSMLALDEEWFGKRDSGFELKGISFNEDYPYIAYPFPKQIVIYLTPEVKLFENQACYQLAHEVFHLLSPTGAQDGNNLEEGLAMYAVKLFFEKYLPHDEYWNRNISKSHYRKAYENVNQLLKINSTIIKAIRSRFPESKISHLTLSQFQEVGGNTIPRNLIEELLNPFAYQ